MYERFYELRERPFALSPDPDYLFPSHGHQEALGYLRYALEGHAGFVVITGEIGSGKTTLLQAVLSRLDHDTTVARLVNTLLDPRELIEAILLDLGLEGGGSKPAMLHALAQFLVAERQAGRLVLLVIDEAQNLSRDALEEVRMLSNLETEKSKLLQIVLVGQPDLRRTLDEPELEQLRQRITVSYHLGPLSAAETAAYINHRLRRAAIATPIEFPRSVSDLVYTHSHGVPRMINVIADAILLFGYGSERRHVDVFLAREAIDELQATGVLTTTPVELMPAATPPEPSAVAEDAPRPGPAPWEAAAHPLPRPAAGPQHAPAAAFEDPARELELRAREQVLARREQALAEQRRVLAEQYRLLGVTTSASLDRAPTDRTHTERGHTERGAAPPWPPATTTPSRFEPAAPARLDARSAQPAGWWRRLRRALGAPEPVAERW